MNVKLTTGYLAGDDLCLPPYKVIMSVRDSLAVIDALTGTIISMDQASLKDYLINITEQYVADNNFECNIRYSLITEEVSALFRTIWLMEIDARRLVL